MSPDTIAALETAIEGYAAALAADSLNPQADYNIDGQSVSRGAWRDSMMRLMKEAIQLVNSDTPVWRKTVPPCCHYPYYGC